MHEAKFILLIYECILIVNINLRVRKNSITDSHDRLCMFNELLIHGPRIKERAVAEYFLQIKILNVFLQRNGCTSQLVPTSIIKVESCSRFYVRS